MRYCRASALGFSRRSQNGAGSRAVRRTAAKLVLLACILAAGADEPPVRLKRKPRSEPVPEKLPVMPREQPQPAEEPEGVRLEQSLEEMVARLGRNLEHTDQRLRQKDVGKATRQIQTEVVRDFDALLEHLRRQEQQQQQQSSSTASAKQKRSRPQQGQQMAKKPASGQTPQQAGNQAPNQQTNTGQGGGRSAEERRKLADLYRDVWGHLPQTLRQQMDVYARERFMPKYSELLKQYYATLAEKGRKKGD